jgi:hypothetical protein
MGSCSSYREQPEKKCQEGNEVSQGSTGRSMWGTVRWELLHLSVLTLLLNLGKPHMVCQLTALSVTSSDTKYPGLQKKQKKRKERKGLIIWLEILIPEIKFYELPIALHPVFLTFPVSHTVF